MSEPAYTPPPGTTATAERLLGKAVRLRGINLGHVVDVFVDLQPLRAVGLQVRSPDGQERLVPFALAVVTEEGVEVASPFSLLDEPEVDFYRSGAVAWRTLRGAGAEEEGHPAGLLADIVFAADGTAVECLIESGGASRLAPAPAVRVARPEDAPRHR